ncbi:MAG: hypothetical protein JHC31_09535 [Sulfurihydrogenibium sp.]|nr:hypothetical protein [Sulfurihydrogenibium sp.]
MKEIAFEINATELKKVLKKALKDAEIGCYFIFKEDSIKVVSYEWWPADYEVYADVQANFPLWVEVLLVSIENVKDLLNSLKQIKERYIKGKAVFDDDAGFIEIKDKKMFAYCM